MKKYQYCVIIFTAMILLLFLDCGADKNSITRADTDGPAAAGSSAKVSLVATFPGDTGEWTPEVCARAFRTIGDAGCRVTHVYFNWGEIEKSEGVCDWDECDFTFGCCAAAGLEVSFVLKIIDTDKIGTLPADLAGTNLREPAVRRRFAAFAANLLDRYPGAISCLWIGNEIDGYLHARRDQLEDFIGLYREAYRSARPGHPDVLIGCIFTYHDAKNNASLDIIRRAGAVGDVIGFTFYPQMLEDGASQAVGTCLGEMSDIAAAIDRNFAITECGLGTAGCGGSEEKQALFIKELFAAYGGYCRRMEFLGLFVLYDFSPALNDSIAAEYGLEKNGDYRAFQGSLGLFSNSGLPKKAWGVFLEEMRNLAAQ